MAAAVTRLAHYMSASTHELYHLLFADDGLLETHGADCWRRILYWFFVMDVVEVPITWKKVAGGARLGWIGYEADIQRYLKGIRDSKWPRLDKGGQGQGQYLGQPDEIGVGTALICGRRTGTGATLPEI